MGALVGATQGDAIRLASLKAMLAGRTQNGKPKPGYRRNVQAIRAEIAKLETSRVPA